MTENAVAPEPPVAVAPETPPTPEPPVALYVHIPFCVSLCPYCDFVVYAGAAARGPRARIGAFLEAVLTEIDLRGAALDARFGAARPALDSVYLGGGTPSLLPADDIERLLARVSERFGVADRAEITLEANPGPDERGDLAALRRAGITRISFGAQSLDDGELRRLGRRHRAADVGAAVDGARAAGIGSVNLDLLYDVPDSDVATWMGTLDAALDLEPDHLSLYALTLDDPEAEGLTGETGDHLPNTRGARRWREASRLTQDEDRAAAQYHHASILLAPAGFRGYEISNWAQPGHESRHNLAYWQRRPHEAVGPGAHAFDGASRRWNAARLDGYVTALQGPAPTLPPGGEEPIDSATATAERLILGLRLDTGVPLATTEEVPLAAAFSWALAAELLDVTPDDRVVLTTRGRLLSNELFARLV
ncbi:MAG: radical SAM family heme chaperone HemW [Chloroflexi bacterium]|nr:radical SAM family heme chaperone HemW [Chloroflexota bacterium]